MGCYRIYVGNLPSTVTSEELKSRFQTFCSRVGDELEIKNKNESTFAYLNLYNDEAEGENRRHGDAPLKYEQLPDNIQKCIALMNNTKWKGNQIKVQLAKESFLSKLRKEQQGYQPGNSEQRNAGHHADRFKEQPANNLVRPAFHHDERSSKLLALAGMPPIAPPKKDREHTRIDYSKPPVYDFEIVSSSAISPSKTNGVKNKSKSATAAQSSSDSSDSESEVKEGFIPKFRGLLQNFPELSPTKAKIPESSPTEAKIPEEPSTIKIHATVSPPQIEQPKEKQSGIKFNPLKRQKSNDLRLKSMENRFLQDKKKTDVISHSLKLLNPPTQPSNLEDVPTKKVKSMELFNDDDEDDYESNFAVKKQFEGESGQKLLELKSKWNFDERFQIDDRFKETEEKYEEGTDENGINVEKEKAGEMEILTQMFGHDVVNKSAGERNNSKHSNSDFVIIPRYDPDLEDHREKFSQKLAAKVPKKNQEKVDKAKNSDPKSKELSNAEESSSVVAEPPKKVEYKVAANLKSLFSSDEPSQSKDDNSATFSLLSAFGSKPNENQHSFLKSEPEKKDEPRKFWQSNPFKYDSSDEDEEDDKKQVKPAKAPTHIPFAKKDSFFFKSKDSRFACIEKFFLVPEEDFATVSKNFNDTDRAELKSLVKAKIKNTKRKSEKREESLKRLRRKLKMKKKQTSKSNRKKFAVKQ